MNIGFDAKRAYHNGTGLGHYSRSLLHALANYYPEHEYFLFNPEPSKLYSPLSSSLKEVIPQRFFHRIFSGAWRSSWIKQDLKRLGIQLYHGLSHEIPLGIHKTGIKSVVTIHDLIHERFPGQYNFLDVKIYHKKFKYACMHADRVIAISEQTKQDIVSYYDIDEKKIIVCYQSCNEIFMQQVSEEEKARIREVYSLPHEYFLYVGSIIERKNLLGICKAIRLLRDESSIPLVVIGDGSSYKREVMEYIHQYELSDRIIFLSDRKTAYLPTYQTAVDFPAIYQMATAMIYPSFFEGFGIPVLEALWSKLPVITSNISCLPEAGGAGAYYVDPASAEEIAEAMRKIYSDKELTASMIEKGWQHAQNFTPQKHAESVMNVYKSVW